MYSYTTARALQEERYRSRPTSGRRSFARLSWMLGRSKDWIRLARSPRPAFLSGGRARSWRR